MNLREMFTPELVAAMEQLVDERVAAALEQHAGGNGSPWLTVAEAAEYARVSERSIERLVERDEIRTSTIFRRRLVHRDELDAYMRATTGEDVAPTTSPRRRVRTLDGRTGGAYDALANHARGGRHV